MRINVYTSIVLSRQSVLRVQNDPCVCTVLFGTYISFDSQRQVVGKQLLSGVRYIVTEYSWWNLSQLVGQSSAVYFR